MGRPLTCCHLPPTAAGTASVKPLQPLAGGPHQASLHLCLPALGTCPGTGALASTDKKALPRLVPLSHVGCAGRAGLKQQLCRAGVESSVSDTDPQPPPPGGPHRPGRQTAVLRGPGSQARAGCPSESSGCCRRRGAWPPPGVGSGRDGPQSCLSWQGAAGRPVREGEETAGAGSLPWSSAAALGRPAAARHGRST